MQVQRLKFLPLFALSLGLMMPAKILGQQFDVDTIVYNGPTGKFINFVFIGDGYQAQDLNTYVSDVQNASEYLFTITPFKEYKNYFNVFAIKVPSVESGTDHPGTATDVTEPAFPVANMNTYFDGTFDYFSIHRLLVATDYSAINSVAISNAPFFDQIIMLVNSAEYGGSGGSTATSSLHGLAPEIVAHELGHSFGGLSDEYYAGDFYAGENVNMTQETDPAKVRWKNWIGEEGIGVYQHCCGDNSALWYRPHETCKMRALGPDFPFCAVCREAIIERIHQLFGSPVTASIPTENSVTVCEDTVLFRLEMARPEPNTLQVTWLLNGLFLAQNEDSVEIPPALLLSGMNTLTVEILDATSFVRDESHPVDHTYLMEWIINYAPMQQPEITTSGSTAFCADESIVLTATHATHYFWSTGEITQSITVSQEGEYAVTVTNAYGCSAESEAVNITVYDLPQVFITPDDSVVICEGDTIILSVNQFDEYLWIDGSQTQFIEVFDPGSFEVTVTDANGCTGVSQVVEVVVPPLPVAEISAGGAVSFCESDTILLAANPSASYHWNTGATVQTIEVDSGGLYTLMIGDSTGCVSVPDSVVIEVHPQPDTPTISLMDGVLISSASTGNQWILNGNPVSGALDSLYVPLEDGLYQVMYTDVNGCSSVSGPLEVNITLAESPQEKDVVMIIPNPNHGTFKIQSRIYNVYSVYVINAEGRLVHASQNSTDEIRLLNPVNGVYTAFLIAGNNIHIRKIVVH